MLVLDREEAGWDAARGYTRSRVAAAGFYLFADYAWARRYDLGVSYEGFEPPTAAGDWDQSVGAFAGLSLLEETTVFRADWRRTTPEQGDRIDTFTLRAIFLGAVGLGLGLSLGLSRPLLAASRNLNHLSQELVAAARSQEASSAQQAAGIEETRRTMDVLLQSAQQIADSSSAVLV